MCDGERQHRPGVDIALPAPKPVSLAALLHGDRRAIRAHDAAVRAAPDRVEAELPQRRDGDPATRRCPRVNAHSMAAATFRYLASRNLDPQPHTHCVEASMTRSGAGEWRRIEATAIRRNKRPIGAHYRDELARRLEALGYETLPTTIGPVPGFELGGYDRAVREAFSTRRRTIVAAFKRRGGPTTGLWAEDAQRLRRTAERILGDGNHGDRLDRIANAPTEIVEGAARLSQALETDAACRELAPGLTRSAEDTAKRKETVHAARAMPEPTGLNPGAQGALERHIDRHGEAEARARMRAEEAARPPAGRSLSSSRSAAASTGAMAAASRCEDRHEQE